MPTVNLASDTPRNLDLGNSTGIVLTNTSNETLQYFVDYLDANVAKPIKNGSLSNQVGKNVLTLNKATDIKRDGIRVAVKASVDNGATVATVAY